MTLPAQSIRQVSAAAAANPEQVIAARIPVRLLVLSQAIPESYYPGSLLLWRLLRDYPADQLLVIGPKPRPASLVLECRYEVLPDVRLARLYRSRLNRLKRSLELIGLDDEVSVRRVERLAVEFQPDAVLTVMQESQYYRAATRLCASRDWPMLLWVHDLVECFEPVYSWARERQRRRNAQVYQAAAARFCISPAMAERLRGDFDATGEVLYPIRSDDLTPREPAASAMLRTPARLTIGYAGGLSYGYREGLEGILPGVEAAGAVLRVYSSAPPQIRSDRVVYGGFASDPLETWRKVQAECDVVLLPYGRVESYRDLHETHFPSKLTEYLGLGMPVLIAGPSYAAGVAWGLRNAQAALTLGEPSVPDVREACRRLHGDHSLRVRLAEAAILAGLEQFEPSRIRRQFLKTLGDVSRSAKN